VCVIFESHCIYIYIESLLVEKKKKKDPTVISNDVSRFVSGIVRLFGS
jgi:hypothetical protein